MEQVPNKIDVSGYFDHKEQSIYYKKYRQPPPNVIFEKIFEYLGDKSSYKVAVDVGCGSGQSTLPLADRFGYVFGSDISEEQIKQAKLHDKPNVSFRVCPSEKLDYVESSVQLVTVCAALHWFNIEEFFKEVDRILEPNGVLAIHSYKILDVFHPDYPEIIEIYKKFDQEILAPNSAPNVVLNNQEYKTVTLPYAEQKLYRDQDGFEIVHTISLDELVGFLRSMSPYQVYINKNPGVKDKLLEFKDNILEVFEKHNDSNISLQSPRRYFLVMCKKPS